MRYTTRVWTQDTRPEAPEKPKKGEEPPKGGYRNKNGLRKSKGELSVEGSIQDALRATLEAAEKMGDGAEAVLKVQIEAENGTAETVNPFAA